MRLNVYRADIYTVCYCAVATCDQNLVQDQSQLVQSNYKCQSNSDSDVWSSHFLVLKM